MCLTNPVKPLQVSVISQEYVSFQTVLIIWVNTSTNTTVCLWRKKNQIENKNKVTGCKEKNNTMCSMRNKMVSKFYQQLNKLKGLDYITTSKTTNGATGRDWFARLVLKHF